MISESPLEMLPEVGMRPVIGGGGNGGNNGDRFAVVGGGGGGGEDFGKELGLLLSREQQRRQEASDRERELNIYRSGSAPPSVEGSLSAVGGLLAGDAGAANSFDYGNGILSEEELRSDPAYLAYYYSNVNLNPRLPPPALSKEDWRLAQRLRGGSSVLGGIGDKRKANRPGDFGSGSQCAQHAGSEMETRKLVGSGEWLDRGGDGLIGLSGLSITGRQKNSSDNIQDDAGRSGSLSGHPSRPASCNTFEGSLESVPHIDISSADGLRGAGNGQNVTSVQPIGLSTSQTFASVLGGSLSRSATPDSQRIARVPSPCLPPVGVKMGPTEKKGNNNGSSSFNNFSSNSTESADISAAFSGMKLSRIGVTGEDCHSQYKTHKEVEDSQKYLFDIQGGQNNIDHHSFMKKSDSGNLNLSSVSLPKSYSDLGKNTLLMNMNNSDTVHEGHVGLKRPIVSSASSYLKVPSSSVNSPGGSPAQNAGTPNAAFNNYGLGGYPGSPVLPSMLANHIGNGSLPPLFENTAAASMISPNLDSRSLEGFPTSAAELQNLSRIANQAAAAGIQMPFVDPLYLQYLQTAEYASQFSPNVNDPSIERNYVGHSYNDPIGLQKAYLEAFFSSQNQCNMPFLGKSGSFNHGYYGNPGFGLGVSYPGSPLASPVRTASPGGLGSPIRHGERALRFPSGVRNLGGLMGSWHPDSIGKIDDGFASSLLEEFKSNKTKCFELSEIAGHVVEFSADQYGSRFIQQKLETATIEEKNMVFKEIYPHALSLMTDVFGNYVIQKFFEHGTDAQRRELADQLNGHVLTLSLQMYGCRVIQKAIEVVELDQQTKMVAELDGSVMRCVRDQNGNHVIQKCIECIPQDAIQFIISSFYDQVVTLSTHPYGCRVIQRVLEHCSDPKTQQIVMDEIMKCVCTLAQDQYGNYVVQHVLEHGKPHERSSIIKQLAGQIVQMSQQKFASNVVEKCLTFGGPAERQLMVNEMLGTTDENEPLQAMMKDQFANYVVQKVLETCDDQQRELILSRIKVHLNALKKYTYGKHIVARVEKLVAAGERRIGVQSPFPPS